MTIICNTCAAKHNDGESDFCELLKVKLPVSGLSESPCLKNNN